MPRDTRRTWAWVNRQGGVAVGRMIVAYSRGDGAATNYEIAWVTVALQHLRAGDDSWAQIDPVHRWLRTLWFGERSPATWPPRHPCSPWRPGSPVMAQCKLGRPAAAGGEGAARASSPASVGPVSEGHERS
jgi:GTP-dependent phosphoenolpyruvate carboxykinase